MFPKIYSLSREIGPGEKFTGSVPGPNQTDTYPELMHLPSFSKVIWNFAL